MIEARSIRISRLDEKGRPIGDPVDAGPGVVTVSVMTEYDGKPCEPVACPPMEPITLSGEFTIYDRAALACMFGSIGLLSGEPAFQWRRYNFMIGRSLGQWSRATRLIKRRMGHRRSYRRRSLRTLP